jgi:hypothetical protein
MVRRSERPFAAGGEPDEAAVAAIRERLPVVTPEEASRLANRDLFAGLALEAMFPAMEQICGQWHPDLILREPCEYSSAVVAASAGIPTAQVAISTAETEMASLAVAGTALDEHRTGLSDELGAMPYLTRFPASLDPSPFPTTVRYRSGSARVRPLPDWWGGRDGPLVYVTFGTVLGYLSIATQVYRTVVDALSELTAARVLLTVGTHFDPSTIGPIPDHIHVEPWVDQSDILPGAELVVCHGGSGTVFGALGAGVPVVAVPMFSDQSVNARLLVEAGAGLIVRSHVEDDVVRIEADDDDRPRPAIGNAFASRIARSVRAVLQEPEYRAAARRVADEMEGAPLAEDILDDLA